MIRWLFLIQVVVAGLAEPALAAQRVALVVGNTGYLHVPRLENPGHDAAAVAASLRRTGFDVVELSLNLDRVSLVEGLHRFASKARGVEVALVFYAGHGIEVGGRNFLIPVDAQLTSDADVEFEAIPLDLVLTAVQGASRFRLVVLDACRDNPFIARMQVSSSASRSLRRGLAAVEPPTDTLVAFAARDGQVAADGLGLHSPFTSALLQHLEEPGLEIQLLFRKVRDQVLTATEHAQEPHIYGSLGSDPFYLVPPREPPAARAGDELELAFWRSVEDSTAPDELEAYLRQYPNGAFAALARSRLEGFRTTTRPRAPEEEGMAPPAPAMQNGAERPPQSPEPPRTATATCTKILQKAQLGERLSNADRTLLRRGCAL